MERSRATGAGLMLAALVQALLFLRLLRRRSYFARAAPVALLVLAALALAFWAGVTLLTVEDDLEGLEFAAEPIDEV